MAISRKPIIIFGFSWSNILILIAIQGSLSFEDHSKLISELSYEEFKATYLSDYLLAPRRNEGPYPAAFSFSKNFTVPAGYPQRWDWREHGVITPVRNQKACGGCWAFAVTETVESMYAINHKVQPPHLSVQQVIDCATYNHGCAGGSTCGALMWAQQTSTALVNSTDYPLTDLSEMCTIQPEGRGEVIVSQYECLSITPETEMIQLLYDIGPLIVGVDANTWNSYMGGVLQFHCGSSLNHAVQIVGYDLTGDVPYYIVKNSWGPEWGHQGYIYIRAGLNTCGIAQGVNVIYKVEKAVPIG